MSLDSVERKKYAFKKVLGINRKVEECWKKVVSSRFGGFFYRNANVYSFIFFYLRPSIACVCRRSRGWRWCGRWTWRPCSRGDLRGCKASTGWRRASKAASWSKPRNALTEPRQRRGGEGRSHSSCHNNTCDPLTRREILSYFVWGKRDDEGKFRDWLPLLDSSWSSRSSFPTWRATAATFRRHQRALSSCTRWSEENSPQPRWPCGPLWKSIVTPRGPHFKLY